MLFSLTNRYLVQCKIKIMPALLERPLPITDLPAPLPREIPIDIAVIATGAITPLGNTMLETMQSYYDGRTGIVVKHYPPFNIGENGRDPVVNVTTFGMVKGWDYRELVGIMPYVEVNKKMSPFARYALGAAHQAMSSIQTLDGQKLIVPRLNLDGSLNKTRQWTLNKSLINPLYASVFVGTGEGGAAVSAEALQILLLGQVPTGDYMFRTLNDRGASIITQAYEMLGGAEADTAACASSGKAMLNAIYKIAMGHAEIALVVGAEGLEEKMDYEIGKNNHFITENPITAAEFDALTAVDRGTDPLKVSRAFHKIRNGFTISEGATALLLADPNWAEANNIPILYRIVGAWTTSGAGSNTEPNTAAQEIAMRMARRQAEKIGPIEGKVFNSGHYTGTPVGEPSEVYATQNAFADLQQRLLFFATKRLAGHGLGMAGNLSAAVAGEVLRTGIVPGMVFAGEIMDELAGWNVPIETYQDNEVTDAFVSQFGFGDANVAIALRRARFTLQEYMDRYNARHNRPYQIRSQVA